MFFFGAAITLSGVYQLSRREMNTLRPLGKLRAAVKMVVFIKRAQKARNIDHRWVLPAGDCGASGLVVSARAGAKAAQPKSIASGLKLSKASVMPVDSSRFPSSSNGSSPTIELACCSLRETNGAEETVPRTALDSSYSQIESPPPPPPPPNSDASSTKSDRGGKKSSSSRSSYQKKPYK